MSRFDDAILDSIKKVFKTASSISEETGIDKVRVDVRLSYMRKTKQVIWIKEIGEDRGNRPKKYRKAPSLA